MIGKQLSHFRILEKIGEGGMGEVYRAHDGHLGRDVALKLLPETLTEELERIARFECEARSHRRRRCASPCRSPAGWKPHTRKESFTVI